MTSAPMRHTTIVQRAQAQQDKLTVIGFRVGYLVILYVLMFVKANILPQIKPSIEKWIPISYLGSYGFSQWGSMNCIEK